MKKVLVRLKAGHPTGTMLARLVSDEVIAIQREGVVLDADQVSSSMTCHGQFEISPAADKNESAAPAGGGDNDAGGPEAKAKTRKELQELSMPELREVGKIYGVKDNKKDELIEKILKASK